MRNLLTNDLAPLVDVDWDYCDLSPPAQPTTVTFKKGGASGTTVLTLVLTYVGANLATVTKTPVVL